MTSLESHEWLRGLESPYLWSLHQDPRPSFVDHLMRKEQDIGGRKLKVFTFNNFILKLVLGYEFYVSWANYTAAMTKLDQLELELHSLDIASNNSLYRQMRRAQWHVTLASRACLLARTGQPDLSKQVVGEIVDHVSTFDSVERAGICGIKSRVMMQYGPSARAQALKWAQEAVRTDPQQAEWHLLAGQALERMRKDTKMFTGVPKEELAYLEKAAELNDSPNYAFHLAGAYEHIVRDAFQHHSLNKTFKDSPLYRDISDVSKKTSQLYRSILNSRPNCTKTQIRCLEGMIKLPRQFLDSEELQSIINKVNKAPKKSKSFYNAAGTFFLKMEKDSKTSLHYFDQGSVLGDYACAVNALRLRVKLRQDIDVEGCLMKLADRFQNDSVCHENALSHLAAFYLFKHWDLTEAINTVNNILERNQRSKALMEHTPMFVRTLRPMNLLVVLVNQVRSAEVVPGMVPVHPRIRDKFLADMARHHSQIIEMPVDVYMMDRILDTSARLDPELRRRSKKKKPFQPLHFM